MNRNNNPNNRQNVPKVGNIRQSQMNQHSSPPRPASQQNSPVPESKKSFTYNDKNVFDARVISARKRKFQNKRKKNKFSLKNILPKKPLNSNLSQNPKAKSISKPAIKRKSAKKFLIWEIVLIIAVITVFTFLFIGLKSLSSDENGNGTSGSTDTQTLGSSGINSTHGEPGNGTSKDPNTPSVPLYSEMTLLCTGDVMYHSSQIESAYDNQSGTYDFTPSYAYIKNIVSSADYAVANFETTLAGPDYPYSGFPSFNAPDTGFNALVSAGFDMMLFANNHCYDTGRDGLLRTQEIFNKYDIDYIGARMSKHDKTYKTVEVNGIKLGMLNSTDDLSYGNLSNRTINGIKLSPNDIPLIDLFNHSLMNEFYASVKTSIEELKADGADMIVYFIHWGNEYELKHNSMQESIAQELCNLGVDVIIGSHPHVIQDADVLTSKSDPNHKTVCFYSLGNLISNQNRLTLGNTTENKSYTENGLIVEIKLRKNNNGRCVITDVETIPLWVHRYIPANSNTLKYDIIPIEKALQNPSAYGLENSTFGVTHATEALAMTNKTLSRFASIFDEEIGALS